MYMMVKKRPMITQKRRGNWLLARDEEFKRRIEKEFDEWFKGRVAAHMVG